MLLIGIVAGVLRFWQLGDLPPGLYRDEAYNGLDALGVLEGNRPLFFEDNNGREPAYIYFTAAAVALFGRTALAVRLTAAVIGTLTTVPVYLLTREWYGRSIGLFAAWVWATTVWTIHLSRVGFRAILLIPLLALAAWVATLASRSESTSTNWLWVLSGFLYALGFYTYLAVRLTPLFIIVVALYAVWHLKRVPWRPLILFSSGLLIGVLPWIWLYATSPELLLGRTGQVSIFNPAINGGAFWQTLSQQVGRALGMFFIRGDDIIRHNPPGRPIFDLLMTIPFLIGIWWMIINLKRQAVVFTLSWVGIMLLGTIFAEDTPHFLRAAGILPAALIPAAIGLDQIWRFDRLNVTLRYALLLIFLAGSLTFTIQDYFVTYGSDQETAFLFEAAARDLAEQIEAQSPETVTYLDQTLENGWPSIRFLRSPKRNVKIFDASAEERGIQYNSEPLSLFFYPYGVSGLAEELISFGSTDDLIYAEEGSWARNDLDPQPYQLYAEFGIAPATGQPTSETVAIWHIPNRPEMILLEQAKVSLPQSDTLDIELVWQAQGNLDISEKLGEFVAFVHVVDLSTGMLAGQLDSGPANGRLPTSIWVPGHLYLDRRLIQLDRPYDPETMQIVVGWYPASEPVNRLMLADCRDDERSCDQIEIDLDQ